MEQRTTRSRSKPRHTHAQEKDKNVDGRPPTLTKKEKKKKGTQVGQVLSKHGGRPRGVHLTANEGGRARGVWLVGLSRAPAALKNDPFGFVGRPTSAVKYGKLEIEADFVRLGGRRFMDTIRSASPRPSDLVQRLPLPPPTSLLASRSGQGVPTGSTIWNRSRSTL